MQETKQLASTDRQCGVEYVFQVYGEEVEESLAAGSGHSIAGVVNISPGVGALRQTPIGQQIQYSLHTL